MEAKLKSLKVLELKDILSKASAPAPAKTNKQDLINRIVATPAAVQIYNQLHHASSQPKSAPESNPPNLSSHDDLLAPPEDLDWTTEETSAPATVTVPDPKKSSPAQEPAQPPDAQLVAPTPPSSSNARPEAPSAALPPNVTQPTEKRAVIDNELEKRKARAARFGIPLVEEKGSRSPRARKFTGRPTAKTHSVDDPEKLKARAERFGTSSGDQPAKGSSKRAPVEEVDAEEQERRRKRAERFGTQSIGTKV
ncbi:hypothetical protein F5I97DRAFT_2055740 [Phlebopus sp. FC_14]|nr:hypothetical protein F5I97DRAFT_2055740 [Phlebopus sp. FC_14]